MVAPLLDMEGTWEEVADRAPAFLGRKLRVIVLPADNSAGDAVEAGSLDAKLAAIAARIPSAEQAKLPVDFCDQLDHYIHGIPKQ